MTITDPKVKKLACYSCLVGCHRAIYHSEQGDEGKFHCQAAGLYREKADKYYGERNDVPFFATRLCDKYGLDTRGIASVITWLTRCHEAGILTDEIGIPLSKMGSLEFIETLVRKISFREDFGDVLAGGPIAAAQMVGRGSQELAIDFSQGVEEPHYSPRTWLNTALLYATDTRIRNPIGQVHQIARPFLVWLDWVKKKEGAYITSDVFRAIAKRFWGTELGADCSTYEGKALAAKNIQDGEYVVESLILCDRLYPTLHLGHTQDHVGDPTLESRLLSAVTGDEVSEEELDLVGERLFNLQRAIYARDGRRGRQAETIPEFYFTIPQEVADRGGPECLVPGKNGEVTSRRGTVVDRAEFEKMKDDYYQVRGWDVATGLQTRAKMEELGLGDMVGEMQERGLLA